MSTSENLIDFGIIESHKENIQSLPGGRSARGLANLFSPSPLHNLSTPTPSDTQNVNDTIRQEYEAELLNIAESDDPLEIYDRYVRWTLDAYPSAQATPASQLLPVLERATQAFLTSSQYKNDPRYLKLWLSYIRFFSDSPRETFAFLARHNVGEGLALFYEVFAACLEGAGRWTQAREVYALGIEREARPAARLLRKFREFEDRNSLRPEGGDEPSSPALPTMRPALAAKLAPFDTAARDPQAPQPGSGVGGASAHCRRQKLTIFSDGGGDGPVVADAAEGSKGWENIGSLAERRKENRMEPKPWVGETLKAGGKKTGAKIPIFKDESLRTTLFPNPELEQVTVNPNNGRKERIIVNLEAVYPTPNQLGTELSFEELRAAHRGWLGKVWEPEMRPRHEIRDSSTTIETISRDVSEKLVIRDDRLTVDENGQAKETCRKPRKMKIKEVNETQIIKAKLSSPSGHKMSKRKGSKESTMTLYTKAATDEIYDLFSQPLKKDGDGEDEESSGDEDDDDMTDGDYTSGGESTGTGRLVTISEAGDTNETSEVKSVSEWSELTARKDIPNLDQEDEDDTRPSSATQAENDITRTSRFTEGDDDTFEAIEPRVPSSVEIYHGELVTPTSPDLPSNTRTTYVPIPPEDYVPPTRPYRDSSQVSQNRLPFMTPITEKTESTLGGMTVKDETDYFNSKTPSKNHANQKPPVRLLDDIESSPFHEIVEAQRHPERIAQPVLTKSSKTNQTAATAARVHPSGDRLALEGASSAIIKDAQCNPVHSDTKRLVLEGLPVPISKYQGFFGHEEEQSGRTNEIKKFAKAISKMTKNSNDKTSTNLSVAPTLQLPDSDRSYIVKRELGAGAFAPVYLVESELKGLEHDNKIKARALDPFARKSHEALKMEKMDDGPPSPWEFYIMRQAKRRLSVARAADSIIDVYEMHLYRDECFLIEQYRPQGTLLDLVNVARAESTGFMDENLVMFFSIELLRTVEALHSKGILHGDLKADNCLVRLDALSDTDVWSPRYRKDGTNGWNRKGLALIDFGRGIDMKAFRPDVQFYADWEPSPQDCAELRALRPWTYQIDCHGLAGIVHTMLFGKYIDTVDLKGEGIGEGPKKQKIRESLKRYWQTDIWTRLFDLLLNPTAHASGEEAGKMPVLRGMRDVRGEMEQWLEANSERGVGLQSMLRKLENAVSGKRR